MNAHPDRGGSTAQMQQVNDANEVLQKAVATTSSRYDWKERDREYAEIGKNVIDDINSKLNIDNYVKFLTYIF
jgi:hypothetical protein